MGKPILDIVSPVHLKTDLRSTGTGRLIPIRGKAQAEAVAHAQVVVVRSAPDDPRAVSQWLIEECGLRL